MKCLECSTEIIQTVGKREKQFCNSTCRSNYWQKAKRKIKKNNLPENKIRILTERNGTGTKINFAQPLDVYDMEKSDKINDEPSFKPKCAPKPKKLSDVPKKEEMPINPPQNEPQPPEGLTGIQLMVWKNEQKKKTHVKKPPITNFGTGQKEKETKDPF